MRNLCHSKGRGRTIQGDYETNRSVNKTTNKAVNLSNKENTLQHQHVNPRLPCDTFVSGGHSSPGERFLLSSAESKQAQKPVRAGWTLSVSA